MLAAMPHQIPLPVTIGVKPSRNITANPAPRQGDEALRVHAQRRRPCHRSFSLPGVVAATGRDRLKLTEAPAYFVEDQPGSIYRFEVT